MPFDLVQAEGLLRPLGLRPTALALLPEGKVNSNYLVQTETGPVVVRLHRGSDATVALEAALARRLQGRLPVPALLAEVGRTLVYEHRPGMTLEAALMRKRPLPFERIARQLAQARVALNDVRFPNAGFLNPDLEIAQAWPSAVEGLLGWLIGHCLGPARLESRLEERVRWVVDDARPRLEALAGPPVLVHGDFKPTNLLVDETGLTAVLDWEFAHAGTWLSDVGQLLRHPEALPDGFAEAFLGELNAPEDTMILARTLDLTNLVDFLAQEGDRPILRADVTRRIEEVCDLYERRFPLNAKRL